MNNVMFVAVAVETESGDKDVFCVEFRNPRDVPMGIYDIMGDEYEYISNFQIHCPWGWEAEEDILKELHGFKQRLINGEF